VALVSARPGLHGSAQMENPTKTSTTTLRTIIAIATTSMIESRLAMPSFFGSQATALIWIMLPSRPLERFPGPGLSHSLRGV
jgi:hypothetical protein